jgi:acetoin utilization protein AcuB
MKQQIKNIFSDDLVTIKENANLSEADDLMNNYNIRHLPVMNDNYELVGLLSKSDYSALRYIDSRFTNHKVSVFMSSPVKMVHESATVKQVAKIFIEKKISSVIVTNEHEVVGILTSEDLIRLLIDDRGLLHGMEQMDLSALAADGWISMTSMTQ